MRKLIHLNNGSTVIDSCVTCPINAFKFNERERIIGSIDCNLMWNKPFTVKEIKNGIHPDCRLLDSFEG